MVTMKKENLVKYISFALAVLILGLLVMQFLPFWTTEKETVSINDYLWMPNEHKSVTKLFKAELDDKKFDPIKIVLWPVLTLVLGVAGIVLCILKRGEFLPCLMTVLCGATGVLTYFTNPVYQMGANWQLHAAVAAVVLVAGLVSVVIHLIPEKKAK
jgi:hypothetical protein